MILALEGKERVWGMEAGKSPEKNQSNESSHIKWKITTGHEHETVKEDWQARSWETRKKLENQMKKRREAKRQQNNYGQNTWASHFHYLRECFQDQIGLPIWEPWQAPILSWNNVKIAKGYERVALTWQGIFWEVTRKDILFDNLTELVNREEGMRKWVTNGVTVYQFQDGYNHVLRRHRFAVVPPTSDKVCRGDLRPDRYYIHVYQTRVQTSNGDLKWLRSKEIAKHLWRTWGNSYYPRRQDIRKEPESYEQSRRKKRQRNINPEPTPRYREKSRRNNSPEWRNWQERSPRNDWQQSCKNNDSRKDWETHTWASKDDHHKVRWRTNSKKLNERGNTVRGDNYQKPLTGCPRWKSRQVAKDVHNVVEHFSADFENVCRTLRRISTDLRKITEASSNF